MFYIDLNNFLPLYRLSNIDKLILYWWGLVWLYILRNSCDRIKSNFLCGRKHPSLLYTPPCPSTNVFVRTCLKVRLLFENFIGWNKLKQNNSIILTYCCYKNCNSLLFELSNHKAQRISGKPRKHQEKWLILQQKIAQRFTATK